MKQMKPDIKIEAITRTGEEILITGTVTGLGDRRVEVIADGDLDLRTVATIDRGCWQATLVLPAGVHTVEASVRNYDDFSLCRQEVPRENYIALSDANIWGATVTRHTDGLYYMIFSMWETQNGFKTDWYQYSELGYAVSTRLGGPYIYQGKVLDAAHTNMTNEAPLRWQTGRITVFHNPNIMRSERDGKYYLYFLGTTNDGEVPASYLQRIGVAVADTPRGPWTVSEKPVIDVREVWEWSIVANPSVIEMQHPDGSYFYYAVYKASGTYDGQRLKATGYATAPTPLGPFKQSDAPIMRDPEIGFSVEDCFVWHQNGRYRALAKDMTKGNFTGVMGVYSYALFESENGEDWALSPYKLAFKNEIPWEDGPQTVSHLERSQLFVENGVPRLICNATTPGGKSPYQGDELPYNVQIPLLGVLLASDTKKLTEPAAPAPDMSRMMLLAAAVQEQEVSALSAEMRRTRETALRAAWITLRRDNATAADVAFVSHILQALLATPPS